MQINIFLSHTLKAASSAKPFSLMPFIENDCTVCVCMFEKTAAYSDDENSTVYLCILRVAAHVKKKELFCKDPAPSAFPQSSSWLCAGASPAVPCPS